MFKKIMLAMIFSSLASLAYLAPLAWAQTPASCTLPNCFGVIGFDPQTKKTSTHVNYSDLNQAARAVRAECPNCELAWFKESCAVMVYSSSHNFVVFEKAWYLDTAEKDALATCNSKAQAAGRGKVEDRRRSHRQEGERGFCEVVHQGCTKLPIDNQK